MHLNVGQWKNKHRFLHPGLLATSPWCNFLQFLQLICILSLSMYSWFACSARAVACNRRTYYGGPSGQLKFPPLLLILCLTQVSRHPCESTVHPTGMSMSYLLAKGLENFTYQSAYNMAHCCNIFARLVNPWWWPLFVNPGYYFIPAEHSHWKPSFRITKVLI